MGFFQRLLSADYRKAIAAEAQGDYLVAARHYALCGEISRVADMHLAQARAAADDGERIRALRAALGFAAEGDSRRSMILRLLARALKGRAEAEATAASEDDRRQDLEEAGTLFEEGEAYEVAAECYLALKDAQRAATAYAKAGLLEQVEAVLGRSDADRERRRQENSCFADYELAFQGGQRDEAAEALRQCIEVATDKGGYRQLLAQLEQRLLASGRVTLEAGGQSLTLIGHFPLVLGRDADCDLQTRGPSVSRRHAHLLLAEGGGFALADLNSRNGTWLNGLRLGGQLPLPACGTISLGDSCQLDYQLAGEVSAGLLRLEVTQGMDKGRLAAASSGSFLLTGILPRGPAVEISFRRGKPFARARSGQLWLNKALTGGPVQLLLEDQLELDGELVRVIG